MDSVNGITIKSKRTVLNDGMIRLYPSNNGTWVVIIPNDAIFEGL